MPMSHLLFGVAAVLVIYGFLVVKRIRMDATNWLIVLIGCIAIALTLLYWNSIVQLSRPFFGFSSPLPVQALSLSSVQASSSSSSVLGPPSLSEAFIDRVLVAYHSPAVGLGNVLYQESLTSGIDDAYALAFFLHESSMGTAGVARATHSFGNIRCTAGWSCISAYRAYPSFQEGARDWFRLLSTEYIARGRSTVETIIPVYAPGSDKNDEAAYIAALHAAVSAWRAGRLLV